MREKGTYEWILTSFAFSHRLTKLSIKHVWGDKMPSIEIYRRYCSVFGQGSTILAFLASGVSGPSILILQTAQV